MTNDAQIVAMFSAYAARNARIDELNKEAARVGACCATCSSSEFRALYAKQERSAVMLVAKLRRRKRDGDEQIIAQICEDYGEAIKKVWSDEP